MILFDYLYDNTDVLFYGLYVSTACFFGLSFYNAWYSLNDNTQTTIETPTTDVSTVKALSSDSLLPSPTLHHLSSDQLRTINNVLDREGIRSTSEIGVQTISPYDIIHSDIGIQTINNPLLEVGIQTISDLGINTSPVSILSNPWLYNDHPMSLAYQIIDNSLDNIIANPQLLTHGDLINLIL